MLTLFILAINVFGALFLGIGLIAEIFSDNRGTIEAKRAVRQKKKDGFYG